MPGTLRTLFTLTLAASAALTVATHDARAFEPDQVECIAPASPGGGWDFTCRSVGRILGELDLVPGSVTTTNMPGAGGGVAYSSVVAKRSDDPDLLVAASTATTSRLAQNQFAGMTADQVRWVASLGADFGAIAVPAESEHENLEQLMNAVKEDPRAVAFGGGSAVGGWDHMKVLLTAKTAGVEDVRRIKYVSFTDGGTAMTQMLGGHIQAFTGDISELSGQIGAGRIRVVGVLADQRLPGKFGELPTAQEQGFDVVGANWRGFYTGGEVGDEAYQYWVDAMQTLYESEAWKDAMARNGLVPFWRGGEEFEAFVDKQVEDLQALSREIGIIQ